MPKLFSKPKESKYVSEKECMSYGVGGFALNVSANAIKQAANPIYNITLGVNPALLGLALALPRLWDAITDPVMGLISDKYRTRYGRRRPYIVIGGIVMSLMFVALWMIPGGWSTDLYFWYFLVVSLLFYTAGTVHGVPYMALGFEMSPDYDERTWIMAVRGFFMKVGGLLNQWFFPLTQLAMFQDTLHGVRVIGAIGGGIILITSILPGILVKERLERRATVLPKVGFWKGIKTIFTLKPFLQLTVIAVLLGTSLWMVIHLQLYVNIYYVFEGNQAAGATMTAFVASLYHIIGIAVIPLISKISAKLGKEKTTALCLGTTGIGAALNIVVYNPDYPFLQLLLPILQGPGLASFSIMVASMMADVVDYDEYIHSSRREGLIGALQSWVNKSANSLAFLLSGFILLWTGYDSDLGKNQDPETILKMIASLAIVPTIAVIICLFFLRKYPLNRDYMHKIGRELEERKH